MKAGSHFVSGCDPNSEAGSVLAEIARERGVVSHTEAWSADDRTFEEINVRIARAVVAALAERGLVDVEISDGVVEAARLPGRMEYGMMDGVPVVLDGAHVPSSVAMAVGEAMARHGGPFWVVLAVHHEKNAEALVEPMSRHALGFVATTVPDTGVHCSAEELAEKISGGRVEAMSDPLAALRDAVERSKALDRGWVFVTGSLYLVGAVRGLLDGK